MRVTNILKTKGVDIISVTPDTPVKEVCKILKEKRIGAILALENGKIAGIISERDIARALPDYGGKILDMPTADLMTKSVTTCTSHDDIDSIMQMMTEERVRHMPVVDDGELVGFISIGDVVKNRVVELEESTNQLKEYVTGSSY